MSHTTLTVFTLKPGHRRWGLAQMGSSPPTLKKVPGLRFFKLMGSGAANGFGFWPNLDRYGLMAVWNDASAAASFFERHPLWANYKQRSTEQWTVALAPIKAQGLWDGQNPFATEPAATPPAKFAMEPTAASPVISACPAAASLKRAASASLVSSSTPEASGSSAAPAAAASKATPDVPVAVLTRASIRWRKAPRFWQFVEPTSAALAQVAGVRAAIGLGELPFVRQATFSVWESVKAMQDYAYKDVRHREVIQLTHREKWYGEEMFARFRVLGSTGTLDGRDPLAGLPIGPG